MAFVGRILLLHGAVGIRDVVVVVVVVATIICLCQLVMVVACIQRAIETNMTKDVTTQCLHPHRIGQGKRTSASPCPGANRMVGVVTRVCKVRRFR